MEGLEWGVLWVEGVEMEVGMRDAKSQSNSNSNLKK